jgi:Family of unknown function (DUF6932)
VAGADKEEFKPLLRDGFHTFGLDDRWRLCVERFPGSDTRPEIMANLEHLLVQINEQMIPAEIWIDGSFLTEKLNPDDVDIVMIVTRATFEGLSTEQRLFLDDFSTVSMYDDLRIDNYGAVVDETDHGKGVYSYWRRQFGVSRGGEMKGILQVSVPFVVTQ